MAASYKLGSKGLDDLGKVVDGSLLQTVEPFHHRVVKTRREHFA